MRHFQEHLFDDVILLLQGNNFKRYFSTKQDKSNIQDFRIINKKSLPDASPSKQVEGVPCSLKKYYTKLAGFVNKGG